MKILDLSKGQVKNGDFDNSRMVKKESLDLSKRQPNYIENNKIDKSYIDFSGEDKKGTFLNVTLSDEEERLLEEKIPNLNDYIERLSAYINVKIRIPNIVHVTFLSYKLYRYSFCYNHFEVIIMTEWIGNPFLDKFIPNKNILSKYHLCY